MLVICCQSTNSIGFKDFNVKHAKVARTLNWLKKNNKYYANIIIDNKVLSSLSINGPIDDRLQSTQTTEDSDHKGEDDMISSIFASILSSTYHEDVTIQNILDHMQNGNNSIK